MVHCNTCKYMAAQREGNGHYSCVKIVHGNPSGDTPNEHDLAAVLDGSGYAARLVVLPTFGCVLHESKDNPPV